MHLFPQGMASGIQKISSREADSLPYLKQIMKGSTLVIVFLGWISLSEF